MPSFHARGKSFFHLVLTLLPYLLLAALAWYNLAVTLSLNQGHFTYSLDDPYIHLALAERIAHGDYGINPGEVAAPASSIVWPFLLVPFAWTPFFEYVPLALNLIIAAATIFVYTKITRTVYTQAGLAEPQLAPAVTWTTIALIPTTNLVGLAFTGMEHSLQVFLCAVIVLGIIQVIQDRAAPGTPMTGRLPTAWLVVALVAAPLTRYETLAVTLPALLILIICRAWKPALLALGITAAALGGYSLFLFSHGLGWLPTSVLAKVNQAAFRPTPNFIIDHIRNNLGKDMPQGQVLGGLLLLLIWLAVARRDTPWIERVLGLAAAAGVLAHLSAGQIGWWDRYEVYMIAASVLWVLYLARGLFAWLFTHLGTFSAASMVLGLSLLAGRSYYDKLALTPYAAVNIYEQQYQMHRFAVDYYRAPVAVNDLGWVAYRNPSYILDLWGLASKEALESRTHAMPYQTDWMERMTRAHNIHLVMIYAGQGWFPSQPADWRPVARLHLGHEKRSAGGDVVTFFVTQPADAASTRALLSHFAPTLPPGVKMEILP